MATMEMSKTRMRYNRIARFYDLFGGHGVDRFRKDFLPPLRGMVLEVGIGTGRNIRYYSEDANIIGIDFSAKMLNVAKSELSRLGRKNVVLRNMDVQNLEFDDRTFDYVVTTCVFCSVPDPVRGLREIRRVLKPSGRLVMIEHVLSKNRIIAAFQHALNPLTRWAMGTNINRDTRLNIVNAGLMVVEDRGLAFGGIVRLFVAKR